MNEMKSSLPRLLHKGKRAVIVSTCITIFPFNILFGQSRGAVKAVREILKWSGFQVTGTLEKGGTRKYPELTDRGEGTVQETGAEVEVLTLKSYCHLCSRPSDVIAIHSKVQK